MFKHALVIVLLIFVGFFGLFIDSVKASEILSINVCINDAHHGSNYIGAYDFPLGVFRVPIPNGYHLVTDGQALDRNGEKWLRVRSIAYQDYAYAGEAIGWIKNQYVVEDNSDLSECFKRY
jgi:hypothetical protein